ncbi:hypothetical protein PoB_001599900 [Plakobranchus ocellatus]|uniref:Uncharacterized protein n=1 Tax=Plakobranchus ocellatus TaxID=259542 RepID=A0AAV3Z540_9GAST|nr:hypothetical protein PoB_001599900 [Plakobranchus ocellatus]
MSLPLGQAMRGVSSPREQPSLCLTMLVRGMNYVVDYIDNLLVHSPTWENQMRTEGALQVATICELNRETDLVDLDTHR